MSESLNFHSQSLAIIWHNMIKAAYGLIKLVLTIS